MKKAAYVASLMIHFKSFHLPVLKMLQDNGFETTLIASDDMDLQYCNNKFKVSIERSPFKISNLKAYFELKNIFKTEEFDIIHCHTPVAALLTRLAARKMRKKGTRVIYTAHGFHFFKGAPFINWLIYFPIEWISSFFTDVLITINREDFEFAKKYMRSKEIKYVSGVGVDIQKISDVNIDRDNKRRELGISSDNIALLSIGELNNNKNHETVIRAIAKLGRDDICYIICGRGEKAEYLSNLAKELNVNLKLLGYRDDIAEICKSCDIFAFPSKREGLPVSVIEAMAAGMPCVVSDIRGNNDLIKSEGGYLCKSYDIDEFSEKIKKLIDDTQTRETFGKNNEQEAKKYDIENVTKQIKQIYKL